MDKEIIDKAFIQAIEDGVFSGAQVIVGRNRETLFGDAYGTLLAVKGSPELTMESLFDIASLTKPVCTTTLFMEAMEKGLVRLEDPVKKYLPEFNRSERMTIENLLAHNSGLPAWLPLFKAVTKSAKTYPEICSLFIKEISETRLDAEVGAKRIYSDLGFILLGFVLEVLHGKGLDEIFQRDIASVLPLKHTYFKPRDFPAEIPASLIVATEDCTWRKKLLIGEVQDDNAYALGGVAGNAGLFSTAGDLESFVHFLWDVADGNNKVLSKKTLLRFVGKNIFPKLGWDTVSPESSQAGKYFSEESIGHLGFTGCSLWLDLADRKYIILLSNRVHPSRENEGIKGFRPMIHDMLLENLGMV